MLCMLGDFEFSFKDSQEISKKIELKFAKSSRLSGHWSHHGIGLYDESFSFEAVFYNKSRTFLNEFEQTIESKEPLWLVFGDGRAYEVLVVEAEIKKQLFDGGGSPIKQIVSLTMEVYYE